MTRKALLISIALLALTALLAPATAGALQAKAQRYTVVVAGGIEPNSIRIWLTPDGREIVIDSLVPLEVGGTVCANPEGNANQLRCRAPQIAGFEVNSGPGDDRVLVNRRVGLPVTLRGGAGEDVLGGGSGPDKLLGGPGEDRLLGGRGNDFVHGGPGEDRAMGGPGDDVLRGGPGNDLLWGGLGDDVVRELRGLRGAVRG